MAFYLKKFANTILPRGDASVGRRTQPRQQFILAPNAIIDLRGGQQAARGQQSISLAVSNLDPSWAEIISKRDSWLALEGKTNVLIASFFDTGSERWTEANLVVVSEEIDSANTQNYGSYEFTWLLKSPHWHGGHHGKIYGGQTGIASHWKYSLAGWSSSAETHTVTDNRTLTINNAGNISTHHVLIEVEVTSGTASSITIQNATTGKHELIKSNATATNTVVLIDSAAGTLQTDSVFDFDNIAEGPSHGSNYLFELDAGDNAIHVTIAGGASADVTFTFYDAHA